MSRRSRGVQFIEAEEPAFIKRFKQSAGMKLSDTVETKKAALAHAQANDDDLGDREDEQPQFVIDAGCNISENEAADFLQRNFLKGPAEESIATRNATSEELRGKPVFRKPITNREKKSSAFPDKKPSLTGVDKPISNDAKAPSGALSFNCNDIDDE